MLAITAAVVVIHAALLFAWPHLGSTFHPGLDTSAFLTRVILPTPAPAAAAPTPPPAQVAPEPQPAPEPKFRPVRRANPPPKPPGPEVARAAPTPPATEPVVREQAAERVAPAQDQAGGVSAASLLAPKSTIDFGGGLPPEAITVPLPPADIEPALQFARMPDSAPAKVPRAAQMTFVTTGTFKGEPFKIPSSLNWRQDGRYYDARWALYGPQIGEHTRSATGLLAPQGLVPVAAAVFTPDKHAIGFDYNAGRLRFDTGDTALKQGTFDLLSAALQLGAMLAADPTRYPTGTVIEFPAAHALSGGYWRFTVEADENLAALRVDALPTVHLVHTALTADEPRVDLWLGRTLDYLPARLRITEPNGDTFEHTVSSAYTQRVPLEPTRRRRPPEPAPAPETEAPPPR